MISIFGKEPAPHVQAACDRLVHLIPKFSQRKVNEISSDIELYLDHYSLNFSAADYAIGYIECGFYKITLQEFVPKSGAMDKCIMLFHGYLEHTGINSYLVEHLIAEGYRVVAADLPGHGLSSGERATISNFNVYGNVVNSVFEALNAEDCEIAGAIGHSTGCAAMIDFFNRFDIRMNKCVMICPLVRSNMWTISRLGHFFMGQVIDKVPRIHKRHSSNEDFIKFITNEDVMQESFVPLEWVEAMYNWNDDIEKMTDNDQEILVVQGDKDVIVDWRYNVDFIQEHFVNSTVQKVKGANHSLINETEDFRQQAFSLISDYFQGK